MATNPQAQTQNSEYVDVDPIIDNVLSKIPQELQEPFSKIILSGMRVMFDQATHKMLLDELNKPGALDDRISNGIITLIYLLWERSNKTMPPQLVVPATFVLTLEAFRFLQDAQDPEATKTVLGNSVEKSVGGVMERFGVPPDNIEQVLRQYAAENLQGAPKAGGK
jgi:hypothetical protein